ncbi:UNVERIFIED_CONTAM: hypothetical protein FKN15_031552 [Acipenser sinensis]
MYITGDMKDFRKFMQKKPFLLQLLEWSLRGLSQVIMVDNPLSGVLILVALILYNPWYTLTTTVGLLSSTLTALIIGQDSADVSKGVYGFNGALVALLIAVFSAMGDWYWWLLLPCCFAGASCTLLFSGLATLLKGWDIPVMVFPFNSALSLYMSATGPHNLYFPQQHVQPDIVLAHSNVTDLDLLRLLEGVPLGVGQIFACDDLWACGLILLGVFIFSPLLCVHALLGSCVGIITGLSLAVPHNRLYSGLAGFNGALGCMAIGGFFFAFNWKTHLFAITSGKKEPSRQDVCPGGVEHPNYNDVNSWLWNMSHYCNQKTLTRSHSMNVRSVATNCDEHSLSAFDTKKRPATW